jgi:Lrp/AsnC family transcriptional regulator, leucine-responsive regulatory protein
VASSRRSATGIDKTDEAIIRLLKDNGRASNQRIAARLGLSSAAVGARIRRMEREELLRVTLVADFAFAGYGVLLIIGIRTSKRAARDVAADAAALPEVLSVGLAIGIHDIELFAGLPDLAALPRFLQGDLARIPGIEELAVSVVLDMVKYEFDIVPFTRDGEAIP